MKERPILFSGPMVRAILAGSKTQTRRIVRETRCLDPEDADDRGRLALFNPYGVPGERLWVREKHGWVVGAGRRLVYAADGIPKDRFRDTPIDRMKWAPSIHMRRADSRLTLEITEIRVQRLQEISEEDAIAEGVTPLECLGADQAILDTVRGRTHGTHPHVLAYAVLWDTLNDERAPWVGNPWVWAITFQRAA